MWEDMQPEEEYIVRPNSGEEVAAEDVLAETDETSLQKCRGRYLRSTRGYPSDTDDELPF